MAAYAMRQNGLTALRARRGIERFEGIMRAAHVFLRVRGSSLWCLHLSVPILKDE
jgi:hypothetical protein